MADYQPARSFTVNHQGDNSTGVHSGGATHPAHVVQGVMEGTVARPLPTQMPAAIEAGETRGLSHEHDHARINFKPIHTCATCKAKCTNNYSLEKHAAKESHKAFLCTCNTGFGRLATLNRHIAAQAGPKHHCIYCDDNKGFAREDKLIDHLRASHKFGDKAIAQFRGQARAQRDGNEYASPAAATTGVALSVSVSAGHDGAPGGIPGQAENSAGPSAVPAGIVNGGLADFAMFSAADLQPSGSVQDYSWAGAAVDFAGVDFSGLDFSGVDFSGVDFSGLDFADVDGDLDMAGMDGGL